MTTLARLAAGITLGASLIVSVPVVQAGDMGYPDGGGECPSTVVVAARGNDSKDPYSETRYSKQSAFVSNGREGLNIRQFLHYAEARHAAANNGQSLLRDTYVLGLTEEYYPADIWLPEVETGQDILTILPQLGGLANSVISGLKNTVDMGIPGARAAIESYEESSGCTPQYILIGYSLGATILAQQESWLAEKGQLAGTLYVGNAQQAPGDWAAIGASNKNGGIIGRLPDNSLETSRTDSRILYCIPDDVVCDTTLVALQRAIDETDNSPHTQYFLNPEQEVHIGEIADRFSTWISAG